MRSRALTETLPRPDVSLIVEEFRCKTHSISKQIGASASHRSFRVRALGHGTQNTEASANQTRVIDLDEGVRPAIERHMRAVTMEVVTDSGVGGVKAAVVGTQVAINVDGAQVFPDRTQRRGKLHDDWMREWKFRSLYPGVGFVRAGEKWIPGTMPTDVPSQAGDAAYLLQTKMLGDGKLKTMHEVQVANDRFPAVLTKQWPNGCFEVTAFKPDERGVVGPIEYPTMHKSNIFLSGTNQNIELPECVVSLEVPRGSPQSACVYLEGDSFVNHLGRASPNANAGPPRRILVDVPKPVRVDPAQKMLQQNVFGSVQQEAPVEINVGATVWEHFLSGEVRRGESGASRLQRSWTVQLGPFATHTISLEKKAHTSSVMTLLVDNELLAECCSTDLGGPSDTFRCKFQFIGERLLDFRVFEETKDGWPLDSKSEITKPYEYRHTVEVTYVHRAIDNLVDAALTIDGMPFERLPFMIQAHHEQQSLTISPTAMQGQFGITIPKIVVPEDTRNIAQQIGMNVVNQAGGWAAIGESAQQTATEVGANLSRLGLSAWEMLFLSKGVEACAQPAKAEPAGPPPMQQIASQPARYAGAYDESMYAMRSTGSVASEGYISAPVRVMPSAITQASMPARIVHRL